MEFGVRVRFRFGAKIVSEPHLNRTGPQRGSQFGLRARTGPSSGLGFGENCLRTGLHRTVASLLGTLKEITMKSMTHNDEQFQVILGTWKDSV